MSNITDCALGADLSNLTSPERSTLLGFMWLARIYPSIGFLISLPVNIIVLRAYIYIIRIRKVATFTFQFAIVLLELVASICMILSDIFTFWLDSQEVQLDDFSAPVKQCYACKYLQLRSTSVLIIPNRHVLRGALIESTKQYNDDRIRMATPIRQCRSNPSNQTSTRLPKCQSLHSIYSWTHMCTNYWNTRDHL
jgi:hypothetical protein